MIEKKAKSKTAAKKAGQTAKRPAARKSKEPNPAEVRKELALLVQSHAAAMALAVINEGEKGELAPVKYMFELGNIFPPPTDGSEATADEECLAQTLLRRLDLPDEPVVLDDEDESAEPASEEKVTAAADRGLDEHPQGNDTVE